MSALKLTYVHFVPSGDASATTNAKINISTFRAAFVNIAAQLPITMADKKMVSYQPGAHRLAAKTAATLFLLGVPAGAVNLAASADVREHVSWPQLVLLDLLLLTIARLVWVAPWQRWPPRALLVVAAAGAAVTIMADLTYGFTTANAPIDGAAVFVVIVSLWLGWTQTPGLPLVAGPILSTPILAYYGQQLGWSATIPVIGLLAICIGAAEATAWARAQERASAASLRALVEVTAKLDVTVTEHELPAILAGCARDALSARGAAVITNRGTTVEVAANAPANYQPVVPLSGEPLLAVTHTRGRTVIRIPLPDVANLRSIIVELPRRASRRILEPAASLLAELLGRYVNDREEISRQLRTDPLTALGNRTAADDALSELQIGDCVMIFDIDHFKNINDLLGHSGGDAILRQVASFLRAQLRSTDTICRYGGDEFLTVLRATPQPEQIVEGIIQRWTDAEPLATLSCGLAICAPGDTGPTVLERADQALYQAKRTGRARLWTDAEQ